MPHVRQQIRVAVCAALAGLASTGANVHRSSIKARGTGLPFLLVRTPSEQSEPNDIDLPAELDRELIIEIDACAKASANVEDDLDQIAVEIETALGNSALGGLVDSLFLVGTVADFDEGLEQPVGKLTLRWRATYNTLSNAPAVRV